MSKEGSGGDERRRSGEGGGRRNEKTGRSEEFFLCDEGGNFKKAQKTAGKSQLMMVDMGLAGCREARCCGTVGLSDPQWSDWIRWIRWRRWRREG